MSTPVVSTKKITPKNGEEKNGAWLYEVGTPIIINYAVESSGNSTNYIKQLIDWGDETIVESSQLPIGRPFQSHHAYTVIGEYLIKLGAINSNGEESPYNSYNQIRVRITPLAETKKELFRWRGLALPFKGISDNIAAIEDLPVDVTFKLAQDAPALNDDTSPTTTLIIEGEALEFEVGASLVISEDKKLITTTRVVGTKLNIITIDESLPLADSYTRDGTSVRLIRSNLGRSFHKERVNKSWYFPVSYDDDLVKAGVAAVLATSLFERVMLPEFGSRLYEIPFEQNDQFTNNLIEEYVVRAIERWEPRADIVSTSITSFQNDITIKLKLKVNLETFSIDFTLNELLSLVTK